MKVFNRKKGWGEKLLAIEKKRLILSQNFFGGRKEWATVLSCRLSLLPMGDGGGACDILPHWC